MAQIRKNYKYYQPTKTTKLCEMIRIQKHNYIRNFVSGKGIPDESIQGTYKGTKK